jgi:hypothetical protein
MTLKKGLKGHFRPQKEGSKDRGAIEKKNWAPATRPKDRVGLWDPLASEILRGKGTANYRSESLLTECPAGWGFQL